MSRRKQTKPLQWQSDSDDETTQAGSLKPISTKRSGSNKPHNYLPVATSSTTESTTNIVSVSTTTEATTSTTNSSSYYRKAKSFQTTHENGKDSFESNKYKHFALTTKPNGQFSFKNDMLSLVASKSIMPPRKRGRPSSQNLQKSRAVLAAAISAASPRRQSLRLRRSNMAGLTPADRAREKLSHRTCEYCGVVKPTPAALQRHIRKHTGERPFVCQICNKGYKAKRSLFLHQTSYHPELFQNDGTISSITTNLLRETLETRRLAKLNPRHHLIIANDSGSSFTQSGSGMKKTKRDMDEELHESKPSHPHEETALACCSLTNSVTPAEEWNADESAEDIAKRSCPYCFKVCPKPSDLKRHLMVHTGERPFRCQECHKKFKQKGSLLYHQKAAHDLNVELSQGLEERYLRLKTRSAMRSLAAIDGLSSHPSNSFLKDKDSLPDTPIGSLIETESDSSHPLQKQLPLDRVPCSSYSSEFRQGLRRQISNTSECSWSEDVSNSVNVLEIELPDSFNSLLSSADDKSSVKKRMMVRKESIFMTRLDGVCLNTGQKLMAYKCYVCSKLFPSLPGIHSHLATHFDSDVMSFDCQICSETFKSLPEMADHLQAQHKLSHCDLDIDLDNNNVCHSDPQGDSHKEKLNQHHNFRIASRFDDHNNNDVLKLKGCPLMEVDNLPFPGSSADSSSSHEVSLPDSSASEREHTRTTHGVHCCPFCRKGFTSQYLLQRHMQLHQQQFAIQALSAAAYKGVGINGFHPDILSHHPAFHPLQSEKRGLEKNNYRLDQDGGKSVEDRRDLHGTTAEQGVEEKSMSVCFEHLEVRSCEEPNIAKELLAKEGIQEDVTVVLPLDPECEPESLLSTPASELHLKADTTCDSQKGEIRCAPKRSLLPVRKESTGTKSRRKASLPTRFDIKNKVLESTEPISGNTSSSPCLPKSPSLLSSVPSLEPEQLETSLFQDQESTSYLQRHLSLDGDHKELKNSLKDEEMLEKQASYVQSLHAAYGHLQASIFGNGFSTAATMALAAGLLGPFASPVLPNLNLVSGHIALASSTPLSSSYLHPPSPRDLDPQAEDLSTPPGRSLSVSHPDTTTQMTGLLPTTSNSKTDSLVGYPRVLWPQAEDKKSPSSSPSRSPPSLVGYPQVLWPRAKEDNSGRSSPSPPPLSPSPSSSDLVSAKQLKPVWHAFTSDDLRNSTTADGRKVTSLSRTHSRLYVVNQPVDRERICKPSVMPDGRTVYRCIFCHKDFLSYSDINRHMDFHEDIRPYKCNFCEYYARTNSQLKVHMMRHQGIREYCCRLCNYKGVTQSDLNRHMKSQIHLLKSRNECHRCGEGFVTAKNLDKHLSSSCSGRHKMDSDLNFHREAVATL